METNILPKIAFFLALSRLMAYAILINWISPFLI